jgi:MoxR-like ATPase
MQNPGETLGALRSWLSAILVGQEEAVNGVLTGVLVRGHVLLEGVPGVGKTLLARSLSAGLGLSFRRLQGTPDLMPADLLGTHIFQQGRGEFQFRPGPIFTEVLLMDEINRTPPKTQSALLEAMEERQVTVEGTTFALPPHFFVLATQNPLEFEGVYPLPEAQLDRFTLRVTVGYPKPEEERDLAVRSLQVGLTPLPASAPPPLDLASLRAALAMVQVSPQVADYSHALTLGTRRHPSVRLGASPRAGLHLLHASRAFALVSGRGYALPDDVKAVAPWVLSHRIQLHAEAELEGATVPGILMELASSVAVPR